MYLLPCPALPFFPLSHLVSDICMRVCVGVCVQQVRYGASCHRTACLRGRFLPWLLWLALNFIIFAPTTVATSAAARARAAGVTRCLPVTCHSYRAINKTGGNVRTPAPLLRFLHSPSLALTGASFVICSPYFDLFYVHCPAQRTLPCPAPLHSTRSPRRLSAC